MSTPTRASRQGSKPMITLILGGVRSGKSRLAEQLATASRLPVTYIATATEEDDEMRERIAAHRIFRPANWTVIEEPQQLAKALMEHSHAEHCVLVDCLTLWLTHLLMAEDKKIHEQERESLFTTLPTLAGEIIIVSNETNMGVVPLGSLSRRYCDEAGLMHQQLAQLCDRVILTVAGLPHFLKGGAF